MDKNKFKAYMEKRQPFGDSVDLPFVNFALIDYTLPDPKSWEELEDYISDHGDSAELDKTLSAAKYVWELYIEECR